MRGENKAFLTPGATFLLSVIPTRVIPPTLIYWGLLVLSRSENKTTLFQTYLQSTLLRVVTTIVILNVHLALKRIWRSVIRRQNRKRLGPDVIEAPRLKGSLPWNLDILKAGVQARKTEYPGDLFLGYFDTLGYTFNMNLFGGDQLFTCEPECIKAVLSTEFNTFVKGKSFKAKMRSVLGVGVFNSDGEMWQLHRSMSRPYFHRERVTHVDLFAHHSDIAMSCLFSRLSEPGSPAVDIQDLVGRFTLDSATEFLFGTSTNSLDAALPYPHEPPADASATFAAAFGRAQEELVLRFGLGMLWPLFELREDRTEKTMKVINSFTDPILEAKLRLKREGVLKQAEEGDSEKDGDTLLDHLVKFSDDEKLIKDELLNILIAGRDTTAATLTFACYALAMYPECHAKLRAEVLATFGTSQYPTFEDLRGMKYLRAFINEVLRVFPPVPFNERTAVRSTVFNAGGKKIYVPAGAQVPISILHMHRRKDLWGPDADVFDPERWLDQRMKKYLTPNPFIFLPFSAGPRICLGQQFAYNESSYFLVRLLQRVDQITLVPDAQPPESHPPPHWKNGTGRKAIEKFWPKSHLTMYAVGGLWVHMHEASDVKAERAAD